jgi:hypothetical protein
MGGRRRRRPGSIVPDRAPVPSAEEEVPSNAEYEIGYRKPPRSTRFKPGQSGNPKGRPRGAKNLLTLIDEELSSKVAVTEGGKRSVLPKRAVIAKQLVKKAAEGDPRTLQMLLKLPDLVAGDFAVVAGSRAAATPSLELDDQAILDAYRASILESLLGSDQKPEPGIEPSAAENEENGS